MIEIINEIPVGQLVLTIYTGVFILEGERRFFEPRNGPEQMGNARNLIFCRECRMGILFGPIEAIF